MESMLNKKAEIQLAKRHTRDWQKHALNGADRRRMTATTRAGTANTERITAHYTDYKWWGASYKLNPPTPNLYHSNIDGGLIG